MALMKKHAKGVYLDELKRGHDGKFFDIFVVERGGRMVWVAAGQSMDYTLRLRWPIRWCESESIIRSSIHSVNLHYSIQ